jgi:hypothetical protein
MLKESSLWRTPTFSKFIVSRLGQRYTAERSDENFETAAQLLAMAPSSEFVDELVRGMEAGLQGDRVAGVPAALQRKVADVWAVRPHTPTLISVALRLDHPPAATAAVQALVDPKTSAAARKSLLELLAERRIAAAVPVIMARLRDERSDSAKLDLLGALSRFNAPEAGQTILELLPTFTAKVRPAAIAALSSRADWVRSLLALVDRGEIKKEQLSAGDLLAIQKFGDPQIDQLIKKHWGKLRASPKEKDDAIKNLRTIIARAPATRRKAAKPSSSSARSATRSTATAAKSAPTSPAMSATISISSCPRSSIRASESAKNSRSTTSPRKTAKSSLDSSPRTRRSS